MQKALEGCCVSPRYKIRYIPNGYDDIEYPIDRAECRSKKKNAIITVGRLGSEQKNSEMFLSAIERAHNDVAEYYFIGPANEAFGAKVADLEDRRPELASRIHIIGNVANKLELYEYYKFAKCFVLTSRWESFGLVLVEALAHGDYILATDLDPVRDMVGDDGAVGTMVKQNDSDGLARAIDSVCEGDIDVDRIMDRAKEYYQSKVTGLAYDALNC